MQASVIITTNEQADLVERCIDSVLNQDYQDGYEVIVVDDASNDGTIDLIKQKFGKNVSLITKTKKSGWLDSVTRAAKKAKSDILVLFDPHCISDTNWLSTIISIFEKKPELQVITGPANHGSRVMQKVSALTFHAPFISRKKRNIDYVFDDNFAIKKHTLLNLLNSLPVELNVTDGVGSTLLSSLLKKRQITVLYEPSIAVFHISLNFFEYLKEWREFCAETTIIVRKLDRTVKGSNWLRIPFFAAVLFPAARFYQDFTNIFRYRRELHLSILEIPFLLSIVLMGKLWYMIGLFGAFSKTSIKELSN